MNIISKNKLPLNLILLACLAISFQSSGFANEGLITIGQQAPEFPLSSWSSGQPLTLKGLRGKTVVLYFFLPDANCPSCDAFILHARRMIMRHGNDRIAVIGISDTTDKSLKEFSRKTQNQLLSVRDPGGIYTGKVLGKIDRLPHLAIINPMEWILMGMDVLHCNNHKMP